MKKQKSFTIKPEFIGQTIFDLPPDFPKDYTQIHGVFLGGFIREGTDFTIDLENMSVSYDSGVPMSLQDSFTLVVY